MKAAFSIHDVDSVVVERRRAMRNSRHWYDIIELCVRDKDGDEFTIKLFSDRMDLSIRDVR